MHTQNAKGNQHPKFETVHLKSETLPEYRKITAYKTENDTFGSLRPYVALYNNGSLPNCKIEGLQVV